MSKDMSKNPCFPDRSEDHSSRVIGAGGACIDKAYDLEITPSTLNFVPTEVGATSTKQTIFIKNKGFRALTDLSIEWSGTFDVQHSAPVDLKSDDGFEVEVVFTPQFVGTSSGYIIIRCTEFNAAAVIYLNGEGTGENAPSPEMANYLRLGQFDTPGQGSYRANGNRIQDLGAPIATTDAARKQDILEAVADLAVDGSGQSVVERLADTDVPENGAEMVAFKQAGPSARRRTIMSKSREIVSTEDYVDPSWSESDQREGLQELLDFFGENTTFVVNPESGVYRIDDTLLFQSYQRFASSEGVLLQMVNNPTAVFRKRDPARAVFVEFNGLTVTNSNINNWIDEETIGLDLTDVSHFSVRRCRLRDHSRGLVHGGTTPGILGGYYNTIEACEIANCLAGIDALANANTTVVLGGRIHSNRWGIRGISLNDYTIIAALERNRIGLYLQAGVSSVNMPGGRFEGSNRSFTPTSISVSGGVATISGLRHQFLAGDMVVIAGTATDLNGIALVLTATSTDFTFATAAADGSYTTTGVVMTLADGGAALFEPGAFRNNISGAHFSGVADAIIDRDGRNSVTPPGSGLSSTVSVSDNNVLGNSGFSVDSDADGLADGWLLEGPPAGVGLTLSLDPSTKKSGSNSQRITVATSGTTRRSIYRRARVVPGIPWSIYIPYRTDTSQHWNLRVGTSINGFQYGSTPLRYVGEDFSGFMTSFVPTTSEVVITVYMNAGTAAAGSAEKNLWLDSISLCPGVSSGGNPVGSRVTLDQFESSSRPVNPEPLEVVFDSTVGAPVFYDTATQTWKKFDGTPA